MTEQTNCDERTTQFHTVLLCLNLADSATFLTSAVFWGPYFPLRTACLCGYQLANINKYILTVDSLGTDGVWKDICVWC